MKIIAVSIVEAGDALTLSASMDLMTQDDWQPFGSVSVFYDLNNVGSYCHTMVKYDEFDASFRNPDKYARAAGLVVDSIEDTWADHLKREPSPFLPKSNKSPRVPAKPRAVCPVCGGDEWAHANCQRPNCPDGRGLVVPADD